MQPHRAPAPSQVSSFVILALLGFATWSSPAEAKEPPGPIGYAHYDRQGVPPVVLSTCPFWVSYNCICKPGTSVNFNTVTGCSHVSAAQALFNAVDACSDICAREERNGGGFGGGGNVLSPVRTPATGVTLEGAGTLIPSERAGYLGYVPRTGEVAGPLAEKEKLGQWLVEQTQVSWLWFEPGKENSRWEDPTDSAASVQAFWKQDGEPRPLGSCGYSVQAACPLEDVKLGDTLLACSNKDEGDARLLAETACAPLRYNALSQRWKTMGMAGVQRDEGARAPSATVLAVAPMQFLGFIPSRVEPIGPSEDWRRLTEELLERTQGTTVWLAGPVEYYSPKE